MGMITKRQLLSVYKTSVAIADLFGITKQAVSRWDIDSPIPELQYKRLRYEIAPDLFDEHGVFSAAKAAA